MDEDVLVARIRAKVAASSERPLRAPATANEIADFEAAVDLRLPQFYVRLLTEVGNGGYGPGFGIIGIPPTDYVDEDLRAGNNLAEAYLSGRRCDERAWRTPRGFLPLCNWGCGTFSHVDALSEDAVVVTDQVSDDRLEYTETAPSLAGWLSDWIAGVDLGGAMYEIVGYRDGVNPFTKAPLRFPLRRLRGRRVDVDGRL